MFKTTIILHLHVQVFSQSILDTFLLRSLQNVQINSGISLFTAGIEHQMYLPTRFVFFVCCCCCWFDCLFVVCLFFCESDQLLAFAHVHRHVLKYS